MQHPIYYLKDAQLDPSLAAKLAPFIRAYAPHDKVKTWRELRAEGMRPIEKETMDMKDICERAGMGNAYKKAMKARAKRHAIKTSWQSVHYSPHFPSDLLCLMHS